MRKKRNLKSVRKERMWAGRISVLAAGGAGSALISSVQGMTDSLLKKV
jgi:hypothetical protein